MSSAPDSRRRVLALVFCVLSTGSLMSAQTARTPQPRPDMAPSGARRIARQVLPAVVLIRLEGGCLGGGFFVTNDLIATNKHVLACGGRGTVSVAGNWRSFPITATWADPQHDLALVRIADSSSTRPLPLSPRGWPAVGDDIYVAGNPAGLEGTFSAGIVSGLRRSEGLIQFDAPISPGSSGGPVVDARGQVVGVTVASVTQGQNLNFAVPAQYLPPLVARARRAAPETVAPGTRRQPPRPAVAPSPTVAPPAPTHPALRGWSAQPDWHLFVSTAIGDTIVPDKLRALLAAGLDADTPDRRSQAALHVAARRGQVELSRYLLAAGAGIDIRDAQGRTPLMLAAGLGDLDLFTGTTSPWERFWTEPLCRSEVDPAARGRADELTRWHVISGAHRALVQFLLAAGADVNASDKEGRTPLDYAARSALTGIDELIRRTGRTGEQAECALKSAQSPAVRGFRLGMSVGEVTARFRRFRMPETSSCGRLNLDFNEAWGTLRNLALKPEEFAGVSRLRLSFVDERLAYLRVTYRHESMPGKLEEFRAAVSKSLSLAGKWRVADGGENWDQAQVIGCEGFKVMTGYHAGGYVELHDVAALGRLLGRRQEEDARERREAEAERERRSREFRP